MENRKIYLSSFYPLCSTKAGKKAIEEYRFPNYIDGSCRREPDFENKLPCITGLCRPGFAEKLNEGDVVIYVTNKRGVGSRKIITVLEVIKTFKDHKTASDWYISKNTKIPNNLMVKGTKPFDLDKTHKKMGWDSWTKQKQTLKEWNKSYIERANANQKAVQCKIIYQELTKPLKLNEEDFTRKLTAQNPPILNQVEWASIKKIIKLELLNPNSY